MRQMFGMGLPVSGAVLGLAMLWAMPAQGYEHATLGWKPELWPPGETMSVVLVDSELWLERANESRGFSSLEQVREVLQRALDAWAAIPTADIRWEIGEIISQAVWDAMPREDLPLIAVRASGSGPYAAASTTGGREGMERCHVRFRPRSAVSLFRSALHEFGHCLGLGHAEPYIVDPLSLDRDSYPVHWQWDPVMSYGRRWDDGRLTADDEIGASLARPAEGWLETTGTILARVTLPGGEEVPFAYVLATRLLEPRSASYSMGRFTAVRGVYDHEPEFPPEGVADIRGLPPGDYWLLVRAPSGHENPRLISNPRFRAVLDLRQAVRAGPVRVRAGEEVRVTLPVRRVGRLPLGGGR